MYWLLAIVAVLTAAAAGYYIQYTVFNAEPNIIGQQK